MPPFGIDSTPDFFSVVAISTNNFSKIVTFSHLFQHLINYA